MFTILKQTMFFKGWTFETIVMFAFIVLSIFHIFEHFFFVRGHSLVTTGIIYPFRYLCVPLAALTDQHPPEEKYCGTRQEFVVG